MKKQLTALAGGLLMVAAVGACGSSSSSSADASGPSSSSTSTDASTSTTAPNVGQRVFGDSNPANADPSGTSAQAAYTPTGTIVASDNFDPATNGFGFANYGSILPDGSTAATDLTAQTMQQIYGNAVCADTQCDLTPEAQSWMSQVNQAMAGGHCFGFSDAALQFFAGKADPNTYGASTVSQLNYNGNSNLQSFIAENWAFQELPSVQGAQIKGDPNTILNDLKQALTPNPTEMYTIAIFKADGTGGHAITPYAIEDDGNGQFHILVYDNNWPGVTRAIAVDTNADTWQYNAAINPNESSELYQGDAQSQSLSLFPTTPALATQPWPYGGNASQGSGSSTSTTAGNSGSGNSGASSAAFSPGPHDTPAFLVDDQTATELDDIYLDGGDQEHGHLLITNPSGQHVGYVNGQQVNTIPGAIIENQTSDEDWSENSEPDYLVPDGVQYTITLDGTALTEQDPSEDVGIVAPGYDLEVDNINLNPGETDTMKVAADGSSVSYNASAQQAPVLNYGVSDTTSDYSFVVSGDDIPANGTVNLDLPAGGSGLAISTADTGGATNTLSLSLDKEDDSGSHTFAHGGIALADGDSATLNFGDWSPGQSMPLVITQSGVTHTENLSDGGDNSGNTGNSGS